MAQYTSRRRASVATSTVPRPALAPIASSEHTPYAGIASVSASAAAVTSPTRKPVNGPGPTPATTAARSAGALPTSVSTAAICGASSSPCARASTWTRSASTATSGAMPCRPVLIEPAPIEPAPMDTMAAAIAGVAESSTTTSTLRTLSGAITGQSAWTSGRAIASQSAWTFGRRTVPTPLPEKLGYKLGRGQETLSEPDGGVEHRDALRPVAADRFERYDARLVGHPVDPYRQMRV